MFYAHFVVSKKGPLARIWLAAHWDKKLTKAHVFETNIDSSVEAIIQPKVKLALRTSGHLLLGVVRIYSRKAKYLLADCNEAFVKIKMAFRPGVVDLPEENREAAAATITLPETFHDFETTMPDLNDLDVQDQFNVNQSRPEEITMREDLGNITLVGDDGFGDIGIGFDQNIIHDAQMDDTLYVKNPEQDQADKPMDIDFAGPSKDDDFGDDFEGPAGVDDDDDNDDNFGGGVDTDLFGADNFEAGGLFEEPVPEVPPEEPPQPPEREPTPGPSTENIEDTLAPATDQTTTIPDQTTLIPNEAEAFALEPIDVTNMGPERRGKRKRKLVIDEAKGIPGETMKLQLSDTSDIVTTLDLAPPTKKLMHWKETGGVEKLFALPGRTIISKRVVKLFNRNLVTKSMKGDDLDEDQHLLDLERQSVHSEPHPEIEREAARAEQSMANEYDGPPHLEPATIMEESIRTDPGRPSIANSSVMSQLPDQSLVAPPIDQEQPEESFIPPPAADSDDDNDFDNDFGDDHDSPLASPEPEQQEEEAPPEDAFDEELPSPEPEGDEEGEGQTQADDDDRRWTKRTQQLLHIVSRNMDQGRDVTFQSITKSNTRKQVASKFYTLLVLKKQQAVEIQQSGPYADIHITKGPYFGTVY